MIFTRVSRNNDWFTFKMVLLLPLSLQCVSNYLFAVSIANMFLITSKINVETSRWR